jgi:hypothetical protein
LEEIRLKQPEAAADLTLGWSNFLTGSFEIETLPGDHYSIVEEPNVIGLADKLGLNQVLNL